MAQAEAVQTYKINGYSSEQVDFTIQELQKGTDALTLQILLFRKFGMMDTKADDLIAQSTKMSGIRVKNHLAESERIYANYLHAESEALKNQPIEPNLEKTDNSGNVILGLIIFTIGLVVTIGSDGHVIAYGAILVGAARMFSGAI